MVQLSIMVLHICSIHTYIYRIHFALIQSTILHIRILYFLCMTDPGKVNKASHCILALTHMANTTPGSIVLISLRTPEGVGHNANNRFIAAWAQ